MKRVATGWFILHIVVMAIGLIPLGHGADLKEARTAFRSGNYEAAEKIATEAVTLGTWNDQWPRLLIETQLTVGKYPEALATYEEALKRFSNSLALRLQGVEVLRFNNLGDRALNEQAQIFEMLSRSPARYTGSENLVSAGRYFMQRGEDGRKILELFFDRVRDNDPRYVEAYIATAELALSKHDDAVASGALKRAAELDDSNPYIAYLAAQAWESSEPQRASAEIDRALEINPNHTPTLLMMVDRWIDREQYDQSQEVLAQIEKINPRHPMLWAYRSVLAHLSGDWAKEKEYREKALEPWNRNPEVDYLIGRKLSQKYRFAQGAAAQRRALEFDPKHREARFQLAQDLLRLAEDQTGWEVAQSVQEEDPYNVVAFNLLTLYDHLKKFTVIRKGDFLVRMEPREAAIYGEDVIELLEQAKESLCSKYGVQPEGPIVVEIFPRQEDFAIRTFGLPGGDGFLGVCFGKVITANSPASQGDSPANWQSVLWHEFCHAVTLQKTNNRMPRWLSEGISVYEERQRDGRWGQQMTPVFREMILGDDMVPISKLSGAFLQPKSPMHLQLAYFISSLAVEYIIDQHGQEALDRILSDLGAGMSIDAAIERSVGTLDRIDKDFVCYARGKARLYGFRFDWSEDALPEGGDFPEGDAEKWNAWIAEHPNNYWGLRKAAVAQVKAGEFSQAVETLQTILNLFAPETTDPEALQQLAEVRRKLGDEPRTENVTGELSVLDDLDEIGVLDNLDELDVLKELAEVQSDGLASRLRLMELLEQSGQWEDLSRVAQETLAVNPLIQRPHEMFVMACEKLGREAESARSLQALTVIDPVDPAALYFRTAKALLAAGDVEGAKRKVLMALEEAPRYHEAQLLLLEIVAGKPEPRDAAAADQNGPETEATEARGAKDDTKDSDE